MPVRIQSKRTKGFRLPPNTVYVGRPTKWGNPHRVLAGETTDIAVFAYRDLMIRKLQDDPIRWGWGLFELKGKNLACYCPLDQPCHADVLLELANADA